MSVLQIAATEGRVPHLQAGNTRNKGDVANDLQPKRDISIYNRFEGIAPPDTSDFVRTEPWMEFKTEGGGPPFRDNCDATEDERLWEIEEGSFTPHTVEGNQAHGQLEQDTGTRNSLQFRHFSFSIVVRGDHALFLRCEPTATVVTAAFNHFTNSRLMADFFGRLDHPSAREQSHDISIQSEKLEPEVDARVKEKLGIKDKNIPLYKYNVRGLVGMDHAYDPRSPSQNGLLVSRCTRSLPMVWIPAEDVIGDTRTFSETGERDADQYTGQDEDDKQGPWSEERIIYMKDTWRFLSDSPGVKPMPEHQIHEIPHRHGTSNAPEHVAGGDVGVGRAQTQELVDVPWLYVWPRISPYQHYRLVHAIIGHPLFKFECTKQLVAAVFDALQGEFISSYA